MAHATHPHTPATLPFVAEELADVAAILDRMREDAAWQQSPALDYLAVRLRRCAATMSREVRA